MVTKSYIEDTLTQLDRLYRNSNSQKKSIYYSKLALIELCGWIEVSMDDIIEKHCNRRLRKHENKKDVNRKIIAPNHGFQYSKNFRPMLMKTIGIIALEKIENKLETNGAKITRLSSTLANLKVNRNNATHTFVKGTTSSFNAPSRIKNTFGIIYPILKDIEREVRKT